MLPQVRYRFRPKKAPLALLFLVLLVIIAAAGLNAHHSHQLAERQRFLLTPVRLKEPAIIPVPKAEVPSHLPFAIGEDSGVLWNLTTGQLMWALKPHLKGPYASTTKLMTIYLAMQTLPLDKTLTVTSEAASTTGSDINMTVGDHFTVEQLYYGLMMRSANDAAVLLSQAVSGNTMRFVHEMDQTARLLGMSGTAYGDPDGLSAVSSGTAWDLSIIARLDLQNALFRQIVHTKLKALPYNSTVSNINGLLYMDPTVIGVKSGWTTQAGFNLVFAATRIVNGHPVTILGVVMHGQNGFPPEYQDAEHILNWGYAQLERP